MNDVITFIREKEYKYIKDLGNGSFGKTVLIKDEELDTLYACKKYSPMFEASTKYFEKFISEIKILNNMLNENIVRIYNSYIYSNKQIGYIIMEYVNGNNISEYIKLNPKEINSIFEQLINAFMYLERKNICHRDIRAKNILVNEKGIVKVIDFGFGKEFTLDSEVSDSTKCNNWICDLPDEMMISEPKYNNLTDMYFIGNLIKQIINDNNLFFKYNKIIERMTKKNPEERYKSFNEISKILNETNVTNLIVITDNEKKIYRRFVNSLMDIIDKVEYSASLEKDINRIVQNLIELCNKNVFEEYILDNEELINCFINGNFKYNTIKTEIDFNSGEEYNTNIMYLNVIQEFIKWLNHCNESQKKMVMNNILNRLSKVEKYFDIENADDLPF